MREGDGVPSYNVSPMKFPRKGPTVERLLTKTRAAGRMLLALLLATSLASWTPGRAWADESSGVAALAENLAGYSDEIEAVMRQAAAEGVDSVDALNAYLRQAYNSDEGGVAPLSNEGLPPRYFLTNLGQVTSVKLQHPWGSCWAFGAVSALESSVLKARGLGGDDAVFWSGEDVKPQLSNLTNEIDLSEHTVAWFAHQPQTQESGGSQAGEGTSRAGAADGTMTNGTQLGGGYTELAEAQFTAWQGAALEADAPYTYRTDAGFFHPDAAKNDIPWWRFDRSNSEEPDPADATDARNKDWSLDDSVRMNDVVRVQGVRNLPVPVKTTLGSEGPSTYDGYDASATEAIKQALMEVGAVSIAYYSPGSHPSDINPDGSYPDAGEYFNYKEWCQYDNRTAVSSNHEVTVVGWNDSYPASNFKGTVGGSPKDENGNPLNGAWLVKNSWGSNDFFTAAGYPEDDLKWGLEDENGKHTGFFWLSYYDHTITSATAYEVAKADEAFAHNYQYDYLATRQQIPALVKVPTPKTEVANVFTAQGDELLRAVSAHTFAKNATVNVKVYVLDEGEAWPGGGTLVAEQQEVFPFGGYHTIHLAEPVKLAQGQRFVVTENEPTTRANPQTGELEAAAYLPLETVLDASLPNQDLSPTKAIANEGETYITDDGEHWYTPAELEKATTEAMGGLALYHYGNAMIKAFTDDDSDPAPKPVDPVPVDPSPGGDPQQPGALEPERVDFGYAEAKPLSKTGDAATPAAGAAATLALGALASAAVAAFALRRRRA